MQEIVHFFPCFHLLPMDAQWMLNGCSMVASTMITVTTQEKIFENCLKPVPDSEIRCKDTKNIWNMQIYAYT